MEDNDDKKKSSDDSPDSPETKEDKKGEYVADLILHINGSALYNNTQLRQCFLSVHCHYSCVIHAYMHYFYKLPACAVSVSMTCRCHWHWQ